MRISLICFVVGFWMSSPVYGQLAADFEAEQTSGCGVFQAKFKNLSIGHIASYLWDFGNGSTSKQATPSKVYVTPGFYTVCLSVTDSLGVTDKKCKDNYIEVKSSFVADFIVSDTLICAGSTARFEDLTVSPNGNIVDWIWDLSGSVGVTQQSVKSPVTSRYDVGGQYSITLSTRDNKGCVSTVTKPLLKVLDKPVINVDFGGGVVCNAPGALNFTNLGQNLPELTYQWDFGNGSSFAGFNPPPVQYVLPGVFDVSIKVLNAALGCTSERVFPKAVVADNLSYFTQDKNQICSGEAIQFTSTKTVTPDAQSWDFGDGNTSVEADPRHTYTTQGCYFVKHVAIYKGCQSEIISSACINVSTAPIADYALDRNNGCKFPFDINVTNRSTNATSYSWTLNGNVVSTGPQPSIRILSDGQYKIGLTATNQLGCSAYIEKETISGYKIKPVISSSSFSGCAPLLIPFEQKSISADPITSARWTVFTPVPKVINGLTGSLFLPDVGNFNVRLVVENSAGCIDSLDFPDWIRLGAKPKVGIDLPDELCFGTPITAKDNTNDNVTSYSWRFLATGATFTSKDITIDQYDKPGTYKIGHRALYNGCPGDEVIDSVKILGIKADFDIQMNCDLPLSRVFVNRSPDLDSLHWDFGSTDTLVISRKDSTEYTFPGTGDYKARLIAISQNNTCADTIEKKISVRELKPAFDLSGIEGCAPLTIQILNRSVDAAIYEYIFPGSQEKVSSNEAPGFSFTTPGSSTGVLIATDEFGCRDTVYSDTIMVHQLKADFDYAGGRFCQDSTIFFKNKSSAMNDQITETTWRFGGQSYTNIDTVLVKLDQNSTFNIKLNLKSAFGCSSEKSLDIPVNKIGAEIRTDSLICSVEAAVFTPTLSGQWTDLVWDFGSSQSTDFSPSHRYTADGSYDVKLLVRDSVSGCSVPFLFSNVVRISDPKADFSLIGGAINCVPFIGKFNNKSINADNFFWTFGDASNGSREINSSHLYTEKGFFTVSLIATSSLKCKDTLVMDSLVFVDGPTVFSGAQIDNSVCAPAIASYQATFAAAEDVLIEWGDGAQDALKNSDSTLIVSHVFNESGVFFPVIVVTDNNGCQDFAIMDTAVIHEATADVKVKDRLLCGFDGLFQFIDSSISSSRISGFKFRITGDFTDTTFAQVPSTFYTDQPGKYSLQYILSNQYCSDTLLATDLFQLAYKPVADFTINQTDFCQGDKIKLSNRSLSIGLPIDSVRWIYDNKPFLNDTSGLVVDRGSHTIQLIVSDETTCADTAVQSIEVKSSISADISPVAQVCAGSMIKLSAKINDPVAGMITRWYTNADTLCEDCVEYSIRPLGSTLYHFETVDPSGCILRFDQSVITTPNRIGPITISQDTTICQKEGLPLSASTINDIYAYSWDTTRPGLTCYQFCRNPIAQPGVSTTYVVTVSDGSGCERLDSVTITVVPSGVIDLGPDRTICAKDSFQISLPGLTNARWTGASGISCTNCTDPILRPLGSSAYFLEALSQGCPVSDTIRINVLSARIVAGPADTTICIGSQVRLKSNYPMVRWGPGDFLDNQGADEPLSIPDKSITYTVTHQEDLCMVTDTFRINVLLTTSIDGPDRTVCPNDIVSLGVIGEADSYQWKGPNIVSGQNTSTIEVLAKQSGLYQVIARNKTCQADTQQIQLNVIDFVNIKDTIRFNAIANLPVKINRNFNPGTQYVYTWFPGTDLSCTDCPGPVFFGDSSHQYVFTILDPATACILEQTVWVDIVESCVVSDFFAVPNVFTPNQDGINDILYVIPKAADQILSFKIFDRVGDLVFETYDLDIGWDGSFHNQVAPNGVYVYLIEAECPQTLEKIYLHGDITLIR